MNENAASRTRDHESDILESAVKCPHDSVKPKQQTAVEKQQALDRQIDSWNAFHAEHGLLSDEFSML